MQSFPLLSKTMSKPLTLQSRAALARLASVGRKPFGNPTDARTPHLPEPSSGYNVLVPLSRRAAVLVLLFKEARTGDLRVVVTMRGAGMRACEFCFVLYLLCCVRVWRMIVCVEYRCVQV